MLMSQGPGPKGRVKAFVRRSVEPGEGRGQGVCVRTCACEAQLQKLTRKSQKVWLRDASLFGENTSDC